MRRAAPRIAPGRTPHHDDHAAMSDALARLYRVATQNIGDVVAALSASERAKLAVFCYGRAHLNATGLAIAAQCDLDHLVAASNSATAGHALYVQSREACAPVDKPAHGRRAPITLAAPTSGWLAARAANEPAELTA
jgi:hypothetical protein